MNTKTRFSEEQLIGLAQQGDIEAFNQLFQKYNDKIKQIVYFYTSDWTNVNDLAQEVMIKIFKSLSSFNEHSKFSTWVYKIAQNTIKNYYRSCVFRSESEQKFIIQMQNNQPNSPESNIIGLEMNSLLKKALADLPQDLRVCYGLHLLDGKTYEYIARRMNCPIGTVRSRISRAKKQIKDIVVGYTS
ncbi:sigma-70 family RNA polymerase sigma factor [Legionella waltersii]|uniref:Sigma factor RpoE (Sigma 24) n=1 Tax=Legionella waltersii TaxID=66969 RepID=A0A0W1A0X8_9GAMM|nr:sigma-70 family RNA polymerase sigma factor [Legionella waltersii]KTD75026.1 sigma factor RpoE (sigma 24) [Legionella waltersii]SNV05483.1 DNA-directed RNA polymerase specialized sigma subunit [Legionella waltersii]